MVVYITGNFIAEIAMQAMFIAFLPDGAAVKQYGIPKMMQDALGDEAAPDISHSETAMGR